MFILFFHNTITYITNKEAKAVYYTVIKHKGHLRTRAVGECLLHFSRVLVKNNKTRFFYVLYKQ